MTLTSIWLYGTPNFNSQARWNITYISVFEEWYGVSDWWITGLSAISRGNPLHIECGEPLAVYLRSAFGIQWPVIWMELCVEAYCGARYGGGVQHSANDPR